MKQRILNGNNAFKAECYCLRISWEWEHKGSRTMDTSAKKYCIVESDVMDN